MSGAKRMEVVMSLRGRVGRHNVAGNRQCQNRPEDQQTVITLLNRIPVKDGGAGGTLSDRVVDGVASDALCRAILQFERKHKRPNAPLLGYVEDGEMLTLMKRPLFPRLQRWRLRELPALADQLTDKAAASGSNLRR